MSATKIAEESNLTATGSVKIRVPRPASAGKKVILYVNVTALEAIGSTADFTITKTVNGATYTFAPLAPSTWTQVTQGGGVQSVVFEDLPDECDLNYTLVSATDFDYSVWAERL